MYEYLKLAAAFTMGLGAGILASKSFFQTKYEKIANEEIESVKASISNRSGHIIEDTSLEEPEKFEKAFIEEVESPIKMYSSIDNMYTSNKGTITTAKNDDHIQELAEREHPEDDRPEDCYEITETEYSETALGYDKLTLHYYIQDDMLVEADNGEWTENDIGPEGLERIRHCNEKELYFRNDPSATDYEVIRIEGAYYIDM